MSDFMRKSLVTQFVCAECGDYLTISYDEPKKASNSLEGEDFDITGAAKVHNLVSVHRCKNCYGKVSEPMNALASALKQMIKAADS